jgi:DNA-binding beta-propeller fold protein YncE
MRRKRFALLAFTALACFIQTQFADARDRFYHLGYEMIQVIDGDTDAIVADIAVKGAVRDVGLTADKKFLYVATNRHFVHKVDLAENRVIGTIDINNEGWERFMYGFVLGPDGASAYGALMSRKSDKGEAVVGKPVVAQIDLATGKLLRSVEVPWGVAYLVSVKNGTMLYAIGQDMYKIDTTGRDLKVVETVPMFDKQMNILPLWDRASDNGGVASMNYYTPQAMGLLLVHQDTGDVQDILIKGEPAMAYSVVLSPDRKKAYALMDDLTVIDLAKKSYVASVPIKEGTSYGINVSSDGRKIYAAGGGSTLTIFDAQTLKPIKVLQMATDGMDLRRIGF